MKVIASSRDQFAVVRNLINAPETDRLICATDAGREGELIFRYIYEKAGCKKPFDRLWISSMTDEDIDTMAALLKTLRDASPAPSAGKEETPAIHSEKN